MYRDININQNQYGQRQNTELHFHLETIGLLVFTGEKHAVCFKDYL